MSGRETGYIGLNIKSQSGDSSATIVESCFNSPEKNEWSIVFSVVLGGREERLIRLNSASGVFILSVSDPGRFIIATYENEDWDKSMVWIYDENLNLITEKRVPAMIWSAAVSADGSVCCYTTDISSKASLDQRCFILSCDDGRSLSSFSVANLFGHGVMPGVESINQSSVTFDLDDSGFLAVVSHKGKLLNKEPYFQYRRNLAYKNDYGYSLLYLSDEVSPGEAIDMLRAALGKELDAKTTAMVWRRIGEHLQDGFCDYIGAIEAYEKALAIDANVGAKRRLATCSKKAFEKD